MSKENHKRYLVRKLIITDRNKGKESVLPLMIVNGIKNDNLLEDTEIIKYEHEIEGTEYVSEMHLIYNGSDNNYIISKIF